MLGRTANDLYWLSRYIERAENIARLLEVGYRIVLLPREGEGFHEEWRSTLESAGCIHGYTQRHGDLVSRNVIDYMLFDASNPSSIAACLASARRNGRAQRTALTREMWENLNSSWLEFQAIKPATITSNSLPDLLDWVRSRSALYRGAIAFVNLYNDSRRPLLLLVPQLIGIAVAFPLAFGGAKAWRASVKAQNEKFDRLSRNDLFLSLALWFAAFCALIVGIYFSLEMRRTS